MGDHDYTTPVPKVRGPHLRLLSPSGLVYFAARTGVRYLVTGREIRGAGDNATWLHDATVDYRGGPVVKLTRARWRRVARRWALVGVPGTLLCADGSAAIVRVPYEWLGTGTPAWTDVPWDGLLAGYALGAPLMAAVAWGPRAKALWDSRELRREYIYPTWREVCQITGRRYDPREAVRMIELPRGFGQEVEAGDKPTPVRITLPPLTLDPGVIKRFDRIGHRLGMPGAMVEAHALGSATFLDVAPAALPPRRVNLDTLREAAESADVDRPVIGVANGGKIVSVDLNNDSPHILLSGGSGTGKSNTVAFFEAQRMRHGVYVVYLDYKKWSHDYAHNLPTSRRAYAYEIERIHEALVALGDELMRRRDMSSREELATMTIIDVVVEEANTLMPALVAYWTEERARVKAANRAALADDPDADVTEPPLKSPAVAAIGALVQMGREFSMHVIFPGQSLSASVFGGQGRDRRESFKIRLMAGWDKALWNMLAKGVPYVVCPKAERGLWCVVTSGEAQIVRVPHVIDKVDTRYQDSLRNWILSSPEPSKLPFLDSGAFVSITTGHGIVRPDSTVQDNAVSGGGTVRDIPAQRVPLSGALDKLPGKPISLSALRWAQQNDPRFPAPVDSHGRTGIYELPALVEWKARRDGVPT